MNLEYAGTGTIAGRIAAGICIFSDGRQWRPDNIEIADAGMAAFSLFFMQSASFLAHQRRMEHGRNGSNCKTLFGIEKIPTDNHIGDLLDPAPPELLGPCFEHTLEQMRQHGGMKDFERLGGRLLIAFDGSEYFCSEKRGCPRCLTRKRSSGKTENYHTLLAATLVAPGHNRVLPLMPEFITPQDGAEKQDCERNAAKRWLEQHGERVRELRPVYLGDALFSSQPMCVAVLALGGDFLFVCKQDSHKTLYEYLRGAEPQRHTVTERRMGGRTRTYRYSWVEGVPLRDGKDALNVHWLSVEVVDQTGKTTYRGAFVTSLAISTENVAEIGACARARWKIENESFNVLKNHGYHLEHNFGHGKQHLAQQFVLLNLLAFAFHTVCDSVEKLWQEARAVLGTRKDFFTDLHTVTAYFLFPDWRALCSAMVHGNAPSP
jgi:hypothetical protein